MTTASRNVEREVKLGIEVGAALPDLREVVAASVRQPEEIQRSTYFDTPDLRLWERNITLRHRRSDGAGKWTLKLPLPSSGGALVRTELEWEGDEEQIPAEAIGLVSAIVRRATLERVAELNTERVRYLLEEEGAAWAELTSDSVTVVGGRRDGLRFRQLELEILPDGSDRADEARAVVKALRRAGARPDPHPKLEKVLGPPERLKGLSRKSPAEHVVTWAIYAGLGRLLDHDCRIRAAAPDADVEDIHQARVATRRLRSDLNTLKPLLDPVWVGHVREDLRTVGEALGAVRDTDVLTASLRDAGAGERLIQVLGAQRAASLERLHEMMNERLYVDLLDRLHAAIVRPPVIDRPLAGRKACRVLPPLVDRSWKKLRREVRSGGRSPGDDQLHEVRKRAKQLRYASELSVPVVGKPAKRMAKAAESLQTLLGDHHDAVVARAWLIQVGNGASAEPVGDLAALIAEEDERKKELSGTWRSCYRRMTKPRRRAWLRGAQPR